MTTAATPMITPSMVSRLRSRFARSALTATRHASPSLTVPAPRIRAHVAPSSLLGDSLPQLGEAVAHRDLAVRAGGDLQVVGDDDQRDAAVRVERLQQVHHLGPADAVQVAGRLVGEDHLRVADQRPGDRHPLLLAAGELVGRVVEPVAHADRAQRLPRPAAAARARRTPR